MEREHIIDETCRIRTVTETDRLWQADCGRAHVVGWMVWGDRKFNGLAPAVKIVAQSSPPAPSLSQTAMERCR
jgi:hypothetical protein